MSPSSSAPSINEKTAQKKLQELRPVLEAMAAGDLMTVRLDVVRVVPQVLELAKLVKKERKLFEAAFKEFPLAHVDGLPDYALALWAAEVEYRRLEAEAKVRDQRPDASLVAECRGLRRELLDAAAYLWRADETVLPTLASIRQGAGYVDMADDLTRLAELYGAHWDQVKGRSDVKKADVTRAGTLGTQLMKAVGETDDAALTAWTDLRRRAFTYLYRAYDQIRAGAAYLHFGNAEKLAAYPSLYALRKK